MSSMAIARRQQQYVGGGVAAVLLAALLLSAIPSTCLAQQCGSEAGGAVCAGNLCCSQWGFCGSTSDYCGDGCQSGPCTGSGGSGGCNPPCASNLCCSQWGFCGSTSEYCGTGCQSGPCFPSPPPPPPFDGDVSSIITSAIFDQFLPLRNSAPAYGFYTYEAFLSAAAAYNGFGVAGSSDVQKRELAAFFANVVQETGSGRYVEEINQDFDYCDASTGILCAPGQKYFGRGPIQLSWNYNYNDAGNDIGFDGINNPGIVASDPTISFETAVWFWMTRSSPTCHDAMVNDIGFGATIRVINGGIECGHNPPHPAVQNRVQVYLSYCATLGVDPGNNLYC